MNDSRNILFDYAKGIGITLVVYGHVARGLLKAGLPMDRELHDLIDSVIYSFHMPLFFFLSGMLFLGSMNRHGGRKLIENKFRAVAYPYIVWSLIQGLIEVGFSHFTNNDTSLWQVLSLLWHPRAQFWFLYTLLIVFIGAVLVYRQRDVYWSMAILGSAVGIYVSKCFAVDVYAINSFGQWFVYFALGVTASTLPDRVHVIKNRTILIFLASVLAFAGTQSVYHGMFGNVVDANVPAVRLALAFFGIVFVMTICSLLLRYDWEWLKFLGRHSMEIYLIHIIGSSGTRIILQKLLGITDVGVHLALGMLLGIGIPLFVVAITPRFGLIWLFSPPQKQIAK